MNILSIEEATKFAKGKRSVIITGVTGQDGSFMADYLLKHTNLEVFGGARRLSVANHENIDHLKNETMFHLINFDLTDAHSISQTISHLKPAYFINFAAQSFVKSSWDFPAQTWDTNTTSLIHILESIRLSCPACRFYNAGSSEEFGDVIYEPQDEAHPMRPRSPYGASKVAARQLVKVYRDSYNLYAVQGWLFNHEGTRRGEEFVTRKISKGVARIVKEMEGEQNNSIVPLELGNLDAKRDWSDAEDCIIAVWYMLNQEKYNPKLKAEAERVKSDWNDDMPTSFPSSVLTEFLSKHIKEYVVSSGESHTIREFVEHAFAVAGVQGKWVGEKENEVFVYAGGSNAKTGTFPTVRMGTVLVQINPIYYRPAEVEHLLGNPTHICQELKWEPRTTFKELVWKMVLNDMGCE